VKRGSHGELAPKPHAPYTCPDCRGITVAIGGHVYVEHAWESCPFWAHVIEAYPCLGR